MQFPQSSWEDADWNTPDESPYIIYHFVSADAYTDIETVDEEDTIVSRFSALVYLMDENGDMLSPASAGWEALSVTTESD